MRLHASQLSHFARKVRLLLDHYGADYELVVVDNVADTGAERFGGNPLMSVPVLEDGEIRLFDSDDIARYLVQQLDRADRYRVEDVDITRINARAVLNGIMSAEVKLVLGGRTGLDVESGEYFGKARATIKAGLDWLEANAGLFSAETPTYLDFHLVSAWQHMAYFNTAALNQARLAAVVADLATQPLIAQTAPDVLKPRAAG